MISMKTITLQYYAVLREKAGKSSETRETEAATLRALYDELREAYGFPLEADRVRAAVGEEYVQMDAPVADRMNITFIPPVAGG